MSFYNNNSQFFRAQAIFMKDSLCTFLLSNTWKHCKKKKKTKQNISFIFKQDAKLKRRKDKKLTRSQDS